MSGLGQRLYLASPVWLQNLALSAYGTRLRYLRYGQQQRRILQALRHSERHSAERLQAQQLDDLNRTIRHAYDTVPLYRNRTRHPGTLADLAQLADIPLLQKDELKAPRDAVTSARYRDARLEEIHTGGTTGKPLSIYCDRATLQRNFAFFGRLRAWAGVDSSARVATFGGRIVVPPEQRQPPYWRWNFAARTKLFSSYHLSPATVGEYVQALVRFQPNVIQTYPSSVLPIARYLLEHRVVSVRPHAVITSSETLAPVARATLEAAFGCPVFDYYGAAEMAAFVTQCESGSYHVNPEFGIVEVLREGQPVDLGEAGEIVATGFINPVMPLVRYATGDMAVRGGDTCRCGRAFPILESIEGRQDDVLVTPEGRLVGRMDPIFKAVASLHETRIVQDAVDHVRVEVVMSGPFRPGEKETLERELRNRLGPLMRIEIAEVTALPRTARGKLRAVVNLVRDGHRSEPNPPWSAPRLE